MLIAIFVLENCIGKGCLGVVHQWDNNMSDEPGGPFISFLILDTQNFEEQFPAMWKKGSQCCSLSYFNRKSMDFNFSLVFSILSLWSHN